MANPGKPIHKLSRNFRFPGRDTDRFLENSSIFGCVFQKSVCVAPRNSSNYYFSTICSVLDEFSINWSNSYPGNLPIRVNKTDTYPFDQHFCKISVSNCFWMVKIETMSSKPHRQVTQVCLIVGGDVEVEPFCHFLVPKITC